MLIADKITVQILFGFSLFLLFECKTIQKQMARKQSNSSIDFRKVADLENGSSVYIQNWTNKIFGTLFCKDFKNGDKEQQTAAADEEKVLEKITEIQRVFCNDIQNGKRMEEALKTVETKAFEFVEELNRNPEKKKIIQENAEQFVKNTEIGEQIRTLNKTFTFNSFTDVLNAVDEMLKKRIKIYRPKQSLQKCQNQRRKKRDPENGSMAIEGGRRPWTAKCNGYLVGLIIALVGIVVPAYELYRLSDNFLTINAVLVFLFAVSVIGLVFFLVLLKRIC
ncbi:hypothetical protein niasHT_024066 [Heterodera trifolii]|uniref:Uncharacterized protein n=1 Tax=Heterodera trifolii TaxID=157864 RepID=A0ABD2JZ23_9BILA